MHQNVVFITHNSCSMYFYLVSYNIINKKASNKPSNPVKTLNFLNIFSSSENWLTIEKSTSYSPCCNYEYISTLCFYTTRYIYSTTIFISLFVTFSTSIGNIFTFAISTREWK